MSCASASSRGIVHPQEGTGQATCPTSKAIVAGAVVALAGARFTRRRRLPAAAIVRLGGAGVNAGPVDSRRGLLPSQVSFYSCLTRDISFCFSSSGMLAISMP